MDTQTTMELERKVCGDPRIEVKGTKDEAGLITGYASTFGNFDRVGERPVKGAFAMDLHDFMTDGFIAVGHDHNGLPVATVKEAREDDHGLYIVAEFHSTPEAQSARKIAQERIERGKSVGLSIGYQTLEDEFTEEGRLLKRVKLFEVSLVNIPANPMATVTGIKGGSLAGLTFEEHGETALAAVKSYVDRAGEVHALRTKEGRVLSAASRQRIKTVLEGLDMVDALRAELSDLLAATEPKADPEEVRKQLAIAIANLQGVSI
jgi:HK97 family phage prohead protease